MAENKHREDASNADKYHCPQCANMIPAETRNLSVCMKCVSGSNFVEYKSNFGKICGVK